MIITYDHLIWCKHVTVWK